MTRLGTQLLADLYECKPERLGDPEAICNLMLEAARLAGATVIAHSFHRFEPHGVSGVIVLAESHFAIHTWPEHNYAALDLFTCGQNMTTDACFGYLIESFGSARHSSTRVIRGEVPDSNAQVRRDL